MRAVDQPPASIVAVVEAPQRWVVGLDSMPSFARWRGRQAVATMGANPNNNIPLLLNLGPINEAINPNLQLLHFVGTNCLRFQYDFQFFSCVIISSCRCVSSVVIQYRLTTVPSRNSLLKRENWEASQTAGFLFGAKRV